MSTICVPGIELVQKYKSNHENLYLGRSLNSVRQKIQKNKHPHVEGAMGMTGDSYIIDICDYTT